MKMKVLLALLCWALASFVECAIVSVTPNSAQNVRLHYDDAETSCRSSVIIVGVGTAMHVTDYDVVAIAEELGDSIVFILDPLPRVFVKLFPGPFANKADTLVARMLQQSSEHANASAILPSHVQLCPLASSRANSTIVVGGHSASGAAAFNAAIRNLCEFSVAGYLGLDPFLNYGGGKLSIPSLYWGFSSTTCLVAVSYAAAAYNKPTAAIRALYQLQNDVKSKQCNFLTVA
jgi:hypothetical protein